MSDERNYPVEPMNASTLARRRDHAQRNPFGNTAELMGHIDWQDARIDVLETHLENLLIAVDMALDDLNGGKPNEVQHFLAAAYGRIRKEVDALDALGASSGAGSVGNE